MFNAIYLNRRSDGTTDARLTALNDAQLPTEADVSVRIDYSTLNYKDALAITGKSPVVRRWPMVPGIDGAGEVIASSHPDWRPGDAFILNGWGVGETHLGCLAQRAKLQGEWLIPMPQGMGARTAMSIGTAGYTAMLCVMALQEHGVHPSSGEILVTGASGGVGSLAIAILANWGYRVIASTGKLAHPDYFKSLGAADVVDRAELAMPGKPLQKERWAGVVDCVGSHSLVNALAQTRYGGIVTACGLAQGMELPGSVAPFILRAIKLIGIDSVMAPKATRLVAWQKLATALDAAKLALITEEIALADTLARAGEFIDGKVRGRLVVNVNA